MNEHIVHGKRSEAAQQLKQRGLLRRAETLCFNKRFGLVSGKGERSDLYGFVARLASSLLVEPKAGRQHRSNSVIYGTEKTLPHKKR